MALGARIRGFHGSSLTIKVIRLKAAALARNMARQGGLTQLYTLRSSVQTPDLILDFSIPLTLFEI
jgi:hypothetical protein